MLGSGTENGKLKMDMNLKNGKRDGLLRVWHQNGQLKAKGQFKDDKAVGKHLFWHANGQLREESILDNDKPISITCWDEDGNEIDCD